MLGGCSRGSSAPGSWGSGSPPPPRRVRAPWRSGRRSPRTRRGRRRTIRARGRAALGWRRRRCWTGSSTTVLAGSVLDDPDRRQAVVVGDGLVALVPGDVPVDVLGLLAVGQVRVPVV